MSESRELIDGPIRPPSGSELVEWDFDGWMGRAGESWVDPLEFLIDDPVFGFGKPLLPLSLVDDRRHGRNRPIFQTEAQLAMIRGAARIVAQTAPIAIGLLEALSNYVVGKGFTYEVAARSGRNSPQGLTEAVQDVVDEFCDINDWIGDFEREAHLRVRRDGEAFLGIYPGKNGIARVRAVEPERVTEPGNSSEFEAWLELHEQVDWKFGIVTRYSDVQSVLGYHVVWNPEGTDYDFMPNDDLERALTLETGLMEHIKVNTDRNVKRGLPDVWAVLTDLVGENKLRDAVSLGSAMRAAVPWIQQMPPGTTPGAALNLAVPGSSLTGSGNTAPVGRQRYHKGTVHTVPSKLEYKPLPRGQEEQSIAAAQYIMRAVGTRWNMPEYMISGDASNANYASTLVAESPFVKAREADQRFLVSRFRRVFRKVLAIACRAGRFEQFGVSAIHELMRYLELDIIPPTVATRDELKMAQADALYKQMGILSSTSAAARAGLDLETERKHMEEEGSGNAVGPDMNNFGQGDDGTVEQPGGSNASKSMEGVGVIENPKSAETPSSAPAKHILGESIKFPGEHDQASQEVSDKLFVYGTFRDPNVLIGEVLHHAVSYVPAMLKGFRSDDEGEGYRELRIEPGAETPGYLVSVTPQDLAACDQWEQADYSRKFVTVAIPGQLGDVMAWAYFEIGDIGETMPSMTGKELAGV